MRHIKQFVFATIVQIAVLIQTFIHFLMLFYTFDFVNCFIYKMVMMRLLISRFSMTCLTSRF